MQPQCNNISGISQEIQNCNIQGVSYEKKMLVVNIMWSIIYLQSEMHLLYN